MRSKKWCWPLWLSILETSIVNAWKLYVLVNKRLGVQNTSQLQLRIKLATDLILTPDEEELMEEEEEESDSGRDPGDDMRMDGLPLVAEHHHVITRPKRVARRCKVCHKSALRILHMENCLAVHHKWVKT